MNIVWWHSIGVRQHPVHLWFLRQCIINELSTAWSKQTEPEQLAVYIIDPNDWFVHLSVCRPLLVLKSPDLKI